MNEGLGDGEGRLPSTWVISVKGDVGLRGMEWWLAVEVMGKT